MCFQCSCPEFGCEKCRSFPRVKAREESQPKEQTRTAANKGQDTKVPINSLPVIFGPHIFSGMPQTGIKLEAGAQQHQQTLPPAPWPRSLLAPAAPFLS